MSLRILIAGTSFFLLWISSCAEPTKSPTVTTTSEGEKVKTPPGTAAGKQGNALVRLINANANTKAVDVTSANQQVFDNIAYRTITQYKQFPVGTTGFALRDADGNDPLTMGYQDLLPGLHYSLVALPRRKGAARLRLLRDPLSALPASDARVRLINATEDVDDVDLYIAGSTHHLLHGIDAGTVSGTSVAEMGATAVEIRVPKSTGLMTVGKYDIQPERLYTFVVTGKMGTIEILQIVDQLETSGS